MSRFKASSEVEQRVLFAKQAKANASHEDSSKQFDYAAEKMVVTEVNRGRPILQQDKFDENRRALAFLSP